MIEISYLTEISKPYVSGVRKCSSVDDLKLFIEQWKDLAHDAFVQIMSEEFSWAEYVKGCKLERKGEFAGEAWAKKYGAILLPEMMLFVGLQAQRFHAPEGTVFIRMKEEKIIKRRMDGVYYLDIPK